MSFVLESCLQSVNNSLFGTAQILSHNIPSRLYSGFHVLKQPKMSCGPFIYITMIVQY